MHSINQSSLWRNRPCNFSMRGNHLAYAATQGSHFLYLMIILLSSHSLYLIIILLSSHSLYLIIIFLKFSFSLVDDHLTHVLILLMFSFSIVDDHFTEVLIFYSW